MGDESEAMQAGAGGNQLHRGFPWLAGQERTQAGWSGLLGGFSRFASDALCRPQGRSCSATSRKAVLNNFAHRGDVSAVCGLQGVKVTIEQAQGLDGLRSLMRRSDRVRR